MEDFFSAFNNVLNAIDGFIWGVPLMVLILFGGILLTVRLRGLQFSKLPRALRYMLKNEKGEDATGEVSSIAFYVVGDVAMFIHLRVHLGHVGARKIFGASFAGLLLGGIGALCGFGTLTALETFAGPLSGSLIQAFGYIVAGGLVSLIVTFGARTRAPNPPGRERFPCWEWNSPTHHRARRR